MARRFLALGDSYTIGERVAPDERWPEWLIARLRAEGFDLAPPEIVAVTGWTTDELSAGIDAADPQGPYDLVSLLIGVNNQYRRRDLDNYRNEFRTLLRRAVAFAGGDAGRVLVVSIPDWGGTPFAQDDDRSAAQIASEIDAYNAVARAEAGSAGARFVDITSLSRTDDLEYVADDGLHPSGAQYAAWTDRILPAARAALR